MVILATSQSAHRDRAFAALAWELWDFERSRNRLSNVTSIIFTRLACQFRFEISTIEASKFLEESNNTRISGTNIRYIRVVVG